MTFLKKRHLSILFIAVVSILVGTMATSSARSTRSEILRDLEKFSRVYEKIMTSYVDEEDSDVLIKAAIQAMLDELDPFSAYMDEDTLEDFLTRTRGEFGGLGIIISVRDDYPTVVSPIEDTPAARLGIRGGDKIVEIEGESTQGWNVEDAVDHLRGPRGTSVTIGIQRYGSDEVIPFTIVRDIIEVKSVPYWFTMGDNIGYIRCTNFGEKTAEEMAAALDSLEAQGMQGLILDLRNNPGGLLDAARDVSDLFLDPGQIIVSTRGRDGVRLNEIFALSRRNHARDYPVVVMINEYSASASEIVAGAIQDWDAGIVVGRNSYGKGSVQSLYPVGETEALKLTTAKYYTPSGRCIHKDENDHRLDEDAAVDGLAEDPGPVPEPPEDLPVYQTLNRHRPVLGGGGIMPDIVMEADSISDAALDLERRSAFFSFATRLNAEREPGLDFTVDDGVLADFRAYLAEEQIEFSDEDFAANEDYIRLAIRRDAFYERFGAREAFRTTMARDRVLQETLKLLRGSTSLDSLFVRVESLNE
ncbi:MAG: S41 family peptidase [Candidatus Krumholzibacteriota bacterium]|nr:S41 family peptidase [Candidatus Krumholzibacteriota bacterium]